VALVENGSMNYFMFIMGRACKMALALRVAVSSKCSRYCEQASNKDEISLVYDALQNDNQLYI
jgi:hypothetical protein